MRKALTKEQVRAVVTRSGGPPGVPVMLAKWWGNGLRDVYGERLDEIDAAYPDDICMLWYRQPGFDVSSNDNPEYRFGYRDDYSNSVAHSIGQHVVLLPEWDELDQFLAHMPDPNEPGNFDEVARIAAANPDRYKIGGFWFFLHERFWMIRGMENLMMDYYDEMDGLKRLGKAMVEFYKVIIDRYAALGCDAIFSSDDLGHQTGPMMSPAIFRELYFPLYKEIADYIHARGMHFFLHSCGDNTLLLDDMIASGVDVLHPIQKGCMDMEATAQRFGDRISICAGMDVQHILIDGTPDDVRAEIARMRRIFNRPDGGLLFAMGNGIQPGTPLENIRAAFDEMYAEV